MKGLYLAIVAMLAVGASAAGAYQINSQSCCAGHGCCGGPSGK